MIDTEGNSDPALLGSIAHRLVLEICHRGNRGEVCVGDPEVTPRMSAVAGRGSPRCLAALESCGESDAILFVHADGAGDAEQAYARHVVPVQQAVQGIGRQGQRAVGIVPVREMETWALADPDALAEALGMGQDRTRIHASIGPHAIDHLTDPKRVLNEIAIQVMGLRGFQRVGFDGVLRRIGESARLERLRSLQAFQRLERDTRAALIEMNIISDGSR